MYIQKSLDFGSWLGLNMAQKKSRFAAYESLCPKAQPYCQLIVRLLFIV